MKKLIPVTLLAASISVISVADTKKFYARGDIGASIAANKFEEKEGYVEEALKTSPIFGLGFGYKFNDSFRADITGQYRNTEYSSSADTTKLNQKIQTQVLLVNGYLGIPTGASFAPYLTLGLGYVHNKAGNLVGEDNSLIGPNFTATSKTIYNFAWSVGWGTTINIYKSFDLDLSYKYVSLGHIAVNATETTGGDPIDATEQNIRSHQITCGLIYYF